MQYLIGLGLVACGFVLGTIIISLVSSGKAEDMTREWVRACIKGLVSGEITIETLKKMIEE